MFRPNKIFYWKHLPHHSTTQQLSLTCRRLNWLPLYLSNIYDKSNATNKYKIKYLSLLIHLHQEVIYLFALVYGFVYLIDF